MRNIKYLIFALFLFIPFAVSADEIYSVNMSLDLDKYGNANVVEKWNVKASGGTEWYKAYYNLKNTKIENYKVSMDDTPLKEKNPWDVNGSLSDKKGYYGINETSNGPELCFGKSDMNKHIFTMEYTFKNLVYTTEDSDIIYLTLLPEATVRSFQVNVKGFYTFPDSLDVWGYGYKGYAYVKDGKITMTNEDGLDDEYVVLLVKFPKGTFTTTNTLSEFTNFEAVKALADEGSFEQDYSDYGYNDYCDHSDYYDAS